jgi:hypothetical protein
VLYPRTYNITVYRGSTFDTVVRFKTADALLDVSTHEFEALFYNADDEVILNAVINRLTPHSIEVYISRDLTPSFLTNGTWKLAVTLPNTTRTYFILKGKVTVRS